ncbi:NCS2 family permease [Priestia taiwanensis]|uniref:Guanine permease n=1 Tax=Priestia taiwanensis TaxID=1347902 RepID=A0A917EQY2_9BACI|nr:NCS2 family permease [Priestia taiwanensis]MBM7364320.1 AGZA family xanthine/uracil permease-like MFS transporter [Priestia taiwanensis]GGE73490.1 guanine permease [Priestia taiwanensis]
MFNIFKLKENGTTVKTEMYAGLTTFLTMAYIIIVNPIILKDAGVPFEQAFTATIIAALIGTLLMAFFANYPIAIAPGMGINAYFAYSVVGNNGVTYQVAFAAVFVAGLIFLLLSFTSFRKKLIEAIPHSLKHAIAAGIGLFIAFLGLRMAGVIVANDANLIGLGNLHSNSVILTFIGLTVTLLLMCLNVNGALFIGMVVTSVVAFFMGELTFGGAITSMPSLPEGLIITNPIDAFSDVIEHSLYAVVFSFLLVTIFDTTGTLLGVASKANMFKDGKLPRVERALLSDSISTTVGSMFGTSPSTAYVESSAGVAAGGRTGLTSLVVAVLFLIAAFFSPVIGAISGLSAITSPALIVVGCLMIGSIKEIEWDKIDEAFPAFLVILCIPLTSSIATGIALGFIFYPLMKIAKGQFRTVHPLIYVFAVLFFYQLVFLPH